ncbi:MAG: LytTR family transcriptional regulator [Cytophagales bacterium]|nr:MAG: LytTR family transcriptional regulator [Cytophagales bacterium]
MNPLITLSSIGLPIVPSEAVLLPFPSGRRWVSLHQIVRLEGQTNYTIVFFTNGTHLLVALTLKRLLERIPADQFVRIHRKHLVNRAFIAPTQSTSFMLDLSNGDSVAIARRRIGSFRQQMKQ